MEPVKVELTDFKTKQHVDTLEVDAVLVATGRAPFTQVCAVMSHLCVCMLGPARPCCPECSEVPEALQQRLPAIAGHEERLPTALVAGLQAKGLSDR